MTDAKLEVLNHKLETVVEAWESEGADTKLQRTAIENIKKERGASFKLVGTKFAIPVKKQLVASGVPYVEIPTMGSDSAFVVSISGQSALLNAQSKIMFETSEFARYCTPQNIVKSAKDMGYDDIIRVSFTNRLACRMALEELYKFRIPTAIVEKESENVLFIHPEYLYRNGEPDFTDFRLKMAVYESESAEMFGGSKSQFLITKLKQVKYDEEKLIQFATDVKEGRPTIYGDAFAKSPCYLESKNNSIVVHEKIDGEWVPRDLNISSNANVFEVKNIALVYLATIKNATVMPRKLWNNKFRNGNPDKTDEDVTSVMKERPKYSAETKPYYKVQTLKMQNMIDAVVKEADKKVAMQMGLVSVTDAKAMKEAYNLKAEEVIELMSEGLLPEIKDFLEEEEGLSSAQKMQWLDDLSNAFEGTKKDASLKMNHKFAKGNEVNMEVQKTMEREIQVQREGVKD
jgi:hypothetical protein